MPCTLCRAEVVDKVEFYKKVSNPDTEALIHHVKNNNSRINDEIDETLQDYDLEPLERNHIFNLIQNEINGYGPLTELLENDFVTEIMVNGTNDIYVEIDGKLVKDDSVSFINDKHIIRTIQRIVQPLGRTIDASNPMVDARLKDGSRLNAIILLFEFFFICMLFFFIFF